MAGTSLLALIDDISATLDDIAILTKIAAKKTSGVLGDDLALNAEQVSGVASDRELPVVFAVFKGSFINKLILVPVALVISQYAPAVVMPLLMLGGAYLCFEGFEKVYEKIFHKLSAAKTKDQDVIIDNAVDIEKLEKQKIKGAIRTDFILSAEIVVITLGTVATESILKQAAVLSGIALIMTFGVYGLVALIVKIDDLGFYLIRQDKNIIQKKFGRSLLVLAPYLMKFLGLAGTIAMFLVGGGIITHNLAYLHLAQENMSTVSKMLFDFTTGLVLGAALLLVEKIYLKLKK